MNMIIPSSYQRLQNVLIQSLLFRSWSFSRGSRRDAIYRISSTPLRARWNKFVTFCAYTLISNLCSSFSDTDAPADFHANVKACHSLGIASRLQDSYDDVLGCILAAQRLGSRAPRILIRHQLTQHYEKVGDQKGYGVYEPMKVGFIVSCLKANLSRR